MATRQVAQSVFQVAAFKQNVLLSAKQTCMELIYLNKKQLELTKRVENSATLFNGYQKKLDNGDANILDVNKAQLQLLNIQNEGQQR